MTGCPKLRAWVSVSIPHHDDEGRLLARIRKEAQINWIMLLWPSIVTVLIVLSAFAWRDTLKTERPVRPHIDDIPFRPSHHRHSRRRSSALTAGPSRWSRSSLQMGPRPSLWMGPSSLLDFAWASSEKKPSTGGFSLSRLAAMSVLVTSRHFAVLRIWSLSGHNGLCERTAMQSSTGPRFFGGFLVAWSLLRMLAIDLHTAAANDVSAWLASTVSSNARIASSSAITSTTCPLRSYVSTRNCGWSNSDFGCGVVGTSKVTRTSREPHWGHLQPSAKLFQRKRAPARPNQRAHVQALASFAAVAAHVRIGSGNGNL